MARITSTFRPLNPGTGPVPPPPGLTGNRGGLPDYVNWSYVGTVVLLFGGLAVVSEVTGSNVPWYLGLAIGGVVFLTSGTAESVVTWGLGRVKALADRASGG